jgi:hypothetical protein
MLDPPEKPPDIDKNPCKRLRSEDGIRASSSSFGMELEHQKVGSYPAPDPSVTPGDREGGTCPASVPSGASEPKETCKYSVTSPPPYLVIVENKDSGKLLHPMVFGGIIARSGVKGIVPGGVRAEGRRKIAVTFSASHFANSFLFNPLISNYNLKAYIPNYKLYKNGIIRGVPLDLTNDEILENIQVPASCGKVCKLRRLNRRVNGPEGSEWKPSTTVLLTFVGQTLPKQVYLFYNSINVELYSYPCYVCHICLRFGHTKNKCTSAPRCFRCGESHLGENCPEKDLPPKCANCKGEHLATDSLCPEFIRQKKIKVTMASENISFSEAVKLTPPSKKFYSEIVASTSKVSKQQSQTPKVKISVPSPRLSTKPNLDRRATEALLSYTNGQAVSPQNGCGLRSNPIAPPSLPAIAEKNQLIQLLSQILNFVISNPTDNMISQILPTFTSIVDKMTEDDFVPLNSCS